MHVVYILSSDSKYVLQLNVFFCFYLIYRKIRLKILMPVNFGCTEKVSPKSLSNILQLNFLFIKKID